MNQDIKKLRHELPPYLEKPQKKEKLWTRNFLSIFFINVCMFMSFHMLTPTFPYYIKSLGGTDHLAGIAAAVISVAALLVRPFSGWFMDNKGRKVLFMIGIAVMIATTFYYNTIQLVMLAVIFRFIQGLGWGVSTTGSNTLAADSIPRNRFAEGMGFFSLTAAISLAVAPALGLWSISYYDYQMLFLISGLFAVGSLVLAFIYQYRPLSQKREIKPLLLRDLFNKQAVPPAIEMLLCCLPVGAAMSFIAIYADYRGLGSAGLFFIVMAISSAISRVGSGRIADRKGEGPIVILGVVVITIAVILLILSQGLVTYFLAGVAIGIGFGFTGSSLQSLALRRAPFERRGAASSTYLLAFDIGIGSGGLLAGWVATRFGYDWMFVFMLVPMLLAFLFYFVVIRRMIKKKPLDT